MSINCWKSNSFRDRLITTGHLDERTAFDQGATGPIARASGIDRELRRDHPYAGYADLTVPVPVRQEGDADARFRVRVAELFASFDMVTALSRRLEPGPVSVPCEPASIFRGPGLGRKPARISLLRRAFRRCRALRAGQDKIAIFFELAGVSVHRA